ncbi:hypothetical protein AHF37_08072 [Paragonimus kellicotti]|nr:hypothetical protein AHF37_08072 [Paragonimus kellicotti]
MKSTLAKSREINRVHTARMIAHCLQLCYAEVEAASNNHVERGSDGLQTVKELARRLNLSFGLDLVKIREAMVAFHSEGIQYCVASAAAAASATGQPPGVPPNLLFLEIVSEFSNKLLRPDKKGLSEYVSRVFPNPVGEEWASLHAYRSSLDSELTDYSTVVSGGAHDQPTSTGALHTAQSGAAHGPSARPSAGPGRGRGRRPAVIRESDISLPTQDSALIPQSSSTAVKRKRTSSTNVRGAHAHFATPTVPATDSRVPG